MEIPFFSYQRRFNRDKEFIRDTVKSIAMSGDFILKRNVLELEKSVAATVRATHAVAVGCGTQALFLSLKALGIGAMDEVITPAFSFISSASTIALLGAKPKFVDVDLGSAVAGVNQIEPALTAQTKAVIAVHLFSTLADMPEIEKLCKDSKVQLVEDSAVSMGAKFGEKWAGTFGDVGLYSFFQAKPIGGIGECGIIITQNEEIARRCRMLRNHGQDGITRFLHHDIGFNHRMDEISAAYLMRKINRMKEIVEKRRRIANEYDCEFSSLYPFIVPVKSGHVGRAPYNYVIRVRNRERFKEYMASRGVECKIFYSIPLPYQPVFKHLGYKPGDFPNSEKLSQELIALPMYPELTAEEVNYIISSVKYFCGETSAAYINRHI